MKTRGVVGKRIVAIEQVPIRPRNDACPPVWHVRRIVLDDGSTLTFNVAETEFGEYLITGQHHKRDQS